jgi:hypothetical protein
MSTVQQSCIDMGKLEISRLPVQKEAKQMKELSATSKETIIFGKHLFL